MEKDRMLHPGDVFTDKDRKYQVIAVAYHAKSNEKMIVYQQLFDNFKILTDTSNLIYDLFGVKSAK